MFLRNGQPFNIDSAFEIVDQVDVDGELVDQTFTVLAGEGRRNVDKWPAWGISEVPDPPPPPPPPPTAQHVIAERERRLALGFDYDFGDGRGVHRIGTSPADMIGWDEVTKGSQAAILLGAPTTPLAIVTETGPVSLTALEWQMILAAATQHRQPIWAASFVLQAMDPIPSDFADDDYWAA